MRLVDCYRHYDHCTASTASNRQSDAPLLSCYWIFTRGQKADISYSLPRFQDSDFGPCWKIPQLRLYLGACTFVVQSIFTLLYYISLLSSYYTMLCCLRSP